MNGAAHCGQPFDITNVPNGTCHVEVTANPEKVLHETTTRNDIPLRKVILGDTPWSPHRAGAGLARERPRAPSRW